EKMCSELHGDMQKLGIKSLSDNMPGNPWRWYRDARHARAGSRSDVAMSEPVHGYQVPILRGVWERITSFGALRFWSHAWAAMNLFVGLLVLTYWGFKWTLGPFVLWILGHGALVLLTQWNSKWDEMIQAQISRRYKSRYSAG